jgi:hypothetical protein
VRNVKIALNFGASLVYATAGSKKISAQEIINPISLLRGNMAREIENKIKAFLSVLGFLICSIKK